MKKLLAPKPYEEQPFLVCPVDLKAAYKRFLSLTDDEMRKMARYEIHTELMTAERRMIEAFLPRQHPLMEAFLWFIGILKCYAHGAQQANTMWLLYEYGSLIQHSCDPNTIYRNDNGQLVYIAIKPISKGEPITLSLIGSLYGSMQFRQQKLVNLKLTLCDCSLCKAPIDRSRRIWCPHCRTKDAKSAGFAVYCGDAAKIAHSQLSAIKQMNKTAESDGWWMCSTCKIPLADSIMPIKMETMLAELFQGLARSLGTEDLHEWMEYLTYLYRTTLTVLGPMHWLVGASYFLFSKFYASAWKSHRSVEHAQLAISNGFKYIDFVESLWQEQGSSILYTDIVPWATVMMKICLEANDYGSFSKLAGTYMRRCHVVYGKENKTIQLFHQCIQAIHKFGTSDPELAKSIRVYLSKHDQTPPEIQPIQPDFVTRSTGHLEANFKPSCRPWLQQKPCSGEVASAISARRAPPSRIPERVPPPTTEHPRVIRRYSAAPATRGSAIPPESPRTKLADPSPGRSKVKRSHTSANLVRPTAVPRPRA